MNESELIQTWNSEKPIYEAWGVHIANSICNDLEKDQTDLCSFFKIPVNPRLKDDKSFVDKAFHRPGKGYTDPYNQIEDKVGIRFVVLLLEDIDKICGIIEKNNKWTFDACKHFDEDKENEPLLFTYQSVHYVVRPANDFNINDILIPKTTPCEIQIRTLLQHAHAELTHDAIYKAKKTVKASVHRTVAKSMALIETTDSFFSDATKQLNHGPLEEFSILSRLDAIYENLTGIKPHRQKSSLAVWDSFERFIDDSLINSIQTQLIDKSESICSAIKDHYSEHIMYQQSTILFVYWLMKRKRNALLKDWPLDYKLLELPSIDLGISLDQG
ncbi:GTP pyrophosphokinase family protein [Marinibactrum halimedae]|uniref:RelA/SpoT domain-containing protein n=1 Tax=Marinibactrum halimedae TaxID=1444977 RepID=A0AA37WNP2_9GAMM|nr:hypothetical protein [Marinibactrum halimedae]MCD9458876.1 hypothetical protein [Marinibactrum halimedae]GLS27725.1 hypothetical protein GCM10007877_34440 [Marinibactrum halimedae]